MPFAALCARALVVSLGLLFVVQVASADAVTPPATFKVGIGDQKPDMFVDPRFKKAGISTARIVVAWDIRRDGGQLAELDRWMAAAKLATVKPLVAFGRSRRAGRERLRPAPIELRREFLRLRARYPFVTDWVTWNEANHCSQPVCNRPDLVARYYDAMEGACPECRILGASVLDQPNMARWVQRFERVARRPVRHWGLHNYLDANRFRTSGTRALLRVTKGEVWFTETGGIVRRRKTRKKITFPESTAHAADATRWVFDKLVPLSPRIKRVYLYHWNTGKGISNWDSAFVDQRGRVRPAFAVLRRVLGSIADARARAAARARASAR